MTDISERERGERMKDHPLVCRGFGTYWNQKKNQPTPENLKERERERERESVSGALFQNLVRAFYIDSCLLRGHPN